MEWGILRIGEPPVERRVERGTEQWIGYHLFEWYDSAKGAIILKIPVALLANARTAQHGMMISDA